LNLHVTSACRCREDPQELAGPLLPSCCFRPLQYSIQHKLGLQLFNPLSSIGRLLPVSTVATVNS
jgi:hypothetical protein